MLTILLGILYYYYLTKSFFFDLKSPPVVSVIDSHDVWFNILSLKGGSFISPIFQHTLTLQAQHAITSTADSLSPTQLNQGSSTYSSNNSLSSSPSVHNSSKEHSISLVLLAQVLALDEKEVLKYFRLLNCEEQFLLLKYPLINVFIIIPFFFDNVLYEHERSWMCTMLNFNT